MGCGGVPGRTQMLGQDGGDDDVGKEAAELAQTHRSDQGPSGQRGHEILISMVLETIVDRQAIILYSLKYGKVKCRGRIGRARAGQSPRRIPAAGGGRAGWNARGPSSGGPPARAEDVDLLL